MISLCHVTEKISLKLKIEIFNKIFMLHQDRVWSLPLFLFSFRIKTYVKLQFSAGTISWDKREKKLFNFLNSFSLQFHFLINWERYKYFFLKLLIGLEDIFWNAHLKLSLKRWKLLETVKIFENFDDWFGIVILTRSMDQTKAVL